MTMLLPNEYYSLWPEVARTLVQSHGQDVATLPDGSFHELCQHEKSGVEATTMDQPRLVRYNYVLAR